jgi:hypothetical protein
MRPSERILELFKEREKTAQSETAAAVGAISLYLDERAELERRRTNMLAAVALTAGGQAPDWMANDRLREAGLSFTVYQGMEIPWAVRGIIDEASAEGML